MKTRHSNCRKIRRVLSRKGPMTRREIADATGLENGEVSAHVSEMLDRCELVKSGTKLSPITGQPVGLIRIGRVAA